MMKYLIQLILLFAPLLLSAQPPADRYQADLFPTIMESNDIQFSTAVPQPNPGGGFYETVTGLPLNVDEFSTTPVDLYMDIFEPGGDTLSKRPLVIIAFGGGFLAGSKDHWSIRALCEQLAKKGFVTASIDYRLGMNVFDSDLANRAVYRGLQDIRSAVRFFRADAAGTNIYKIDPAQIFLGGHSAGAFCATHNAYLDKETERPLSTFAWTQDGNAVPDQGCLDCAGDNQSFDGHANGLFSLAGALGFADFIESASDPKPVMFHSTDDDTVPFNSGEPFSSILWLVVGSDLPVVYGSNAMATEATAVGLDFEFFQYTDRGHGVHEDINEQLYDDIIPGISDWFRTEELQPASGTIAGSSVVCSAELEQAYDLQNTTGVYFDWQVSGGTFSMMSNSSTSAKVLWDEMATEHILSVIPYSALDAKGDTAMITIDLLAAGTNTFMAINSDWLDASNWSQGHIPTACENVVINSGATSALTLSTPTEINSLQIGSGVNLTIANTGQLLVHQKLSTNAGYALAVIGEVIAMGDLMVKNEVEGMEVKLIDGGKVEIHGLGELGK